MADDAVKHVRKKLGEHLKELIGLEESLVLDDCTGQCIRFAPKSWNSILLLKNGEWTSTRRILLFEFKFTHNLDLILWIGRGPQSVRQEIFNKLTRTNSVFQPGPSGIRGEFSRVWTNRILNASELKATPEAKERIVKEWDRFKAEHMRELTEAVASRLGGMS